MAKETTPLSPVYMTRQGQIQLETELTHLRTIKRAEVIERLHEAEGGDWLDNIEYMTIQEELGFIDGRISELDQMLRLAEIIQVGTADGTVRIGSTITIQEADGQPETYTIVGLAEANPAAGRISDRSPLGRALLNQTLGSTITVTTPDGPRHIQILAIH